MPFAAYWRRRMSDLRALLEQVAERGTPVGPDVVYERALRQSAALRNPSRARRYAIVASVCAAAAALVVLPLVRSAGDTPFRPPQAHTEVAAAPAATPARLAVKDQSTGRLVLSPVGIGWVGTSWPR
jgi:hypothetical protein